MSREFYFYNGEDNFGLKEEDNDDIDSDLGVKGKVASCRGQARKSGSKLIPSIIVGGSLCIGLTLSPNKVDAKDKTVSIGEMKSREKINESALSLSKIVSSLVEKEVLSESVSSFSELIAEIKNLSFQKELMSDLYDGSNNSEFLFEATKYNEKITRIIVVLNKELNLQLDPLVRAKLSVENGKIVISTWKRIVKDGGGTFTSRTKVEIGSNLNVDK